MQSDLERGVSWLTKSRTMILHKHCLYFNARRAAIKEVKLSKCCLFGICCWLGCFKSCVGHLSLTSAGWFRLSSFPTFALLCSALLPKGLPPRREARFLEVSGLMIIKGIHVNQSAELVPLINVNWCSKNTWEGFFLTL